VLFVWAGLLAEVRLVDASAALGEGAEVTLLSGAVDFLVSVRTAGLEVGVCEPVRLTVVSEERVTDRLVDVSRRPYSELPMVRGEVLFTCELLTVRVAVLPFGEATVLV
jgi:hypothetical protein